MSSFMLHDSMICLNVYLFDEYSRSSENIYEKKEVLSVYQPIKIQSNSPRIIQPSDKENLMYSTVACCKCIQNALPQGLSAIINTANIF